MAPNGEQVQVESRQVWRQWLAANHDRPTGIWLVTFKKHCGDRYVAYNDVVEEALCFGWIDSLPRRLDADRTMLWLAPRQPGSGWSKLNKERVERMITAGQMAPAGLTAIATAKANGSWQTLDAVEALEIPLDLAATLANYETATDNFNAFPRSAKRGILEWIANAKRSQTRARRIEETARLAQDNIRANQWPRS
jgi:uncharacterized protein YdeI (YjbR/CyaY-like superfamily)